MIRKLLYLTLILACANSVQAQYATPNTGVNWGFAELMVNAPSGVITFSAGVYTITQNLTISAADQLTIDENTSIKIDPNVQLTIAGTFIATADQTTITASNITAPYDSIRFEAGATGYLENCTIDYGKGIRVSTGNFEMHDCSMSYHIGGTTTSAALSFSTGSPLVDSSSFTNNVVPAFGSGANQEVSATFSNNYLENNNTSNTNRPQINMGPSGNDTIRIVNNIIKGNPVLTMVGGISASSLLGNINRVIIDGNTIFDNRYGITVIGGTSSGYIRNNIIEDNDTQNLPNSGGSGISLSASNAGMNIIAAGNQIRRNLWGITLITQASINLGTSDVNDNSPGGNIFADNGNGGNIYALYNNTPLTVNAANNCWIEGTEPNAQQVENVITHQADNASLGLVNYTPFSCTLASEEHLAIAPEIYPNPNSGQFSIIVPDDAELNIYSIHGQHLFSQKLISGENRIETQLQHGIYLLKTTTFKATDTRKIIIR